MSRHHHRSRRQWQGRPANPDQNRRCPNTTPSGLQLRRRNRRRLQIGRFPDCDRVSCRARAGGIARECLPVPFPESVTARSTRAFPQQTTCWPHRCPVFRRCRNQPSMRSCPHPARLRRPRSRRLRMCRRHYSGRGCFGRSRWRRTSQANHHHCSHPRHTRNCSGRSRRRVQPRCCGPEMFRRLRCEIKNWADRCARRSKELDSGIDPGPGSSCRRRNICRAGHRDRNRRWRRA